MPGKCRFDQLADALTGKPIFKCEGRRFAQLHLASQSALAASNARGIAEQAVTCKGDNLNTSIWRCLQQAAPRRAVPKQPLDNTCDRQSINLRSSGPDLLCCTGYQTRTFGPRLGERVDSSRAGRAVFAGESVRDGHLLLCLEGRTPARAVDQLASIMKSPTSAPRNLASGAMRLGENVAAVRQHA